MKLDRITSNPNRMNGQPCIRNLRLTVRRVIELLATYPDRAELQLPSTEGKQLIANFLWQLARERPATVRRRLATIASFINFADN